MANNLILAISFGFKLNSNLRYGLTVKVGKYFSPAKHILGMFLQILVSNKKLNYYLIAIIAKHKCVYLNVCIVKLNGKNFSIFIK